jgi:hypothetical protein
LSDFGENGLRETKARLSQFRHRVIENDEARLIGIVENGERARNLEASSQRLPASSPFVDEQDFRFHFDCRRGRFALARVEMCKDQITRGLLEV